MIMDERLEFADATALDTTGTNVDLIGDVIDLGSTASDIGNGQPLYCVIQTVAAVTSPQTPLLRSRSMGQPLRTFLPQLLLLALSRLTRKWQCLLCQLITMRGFSVSLRQPGLPL